MSSNKATGFFYTIAIIFVSFIAIPLSGNEMESKPSYIPEWEYEVLIEMNLARTNPKKYIEFLKERRGYYQKEGYYLLPNSNIRMLTNEGVSAVDEAIRVLSKQKPVGPLSLSKGMSMGAKDHVDDTGPRGLTGHYGTDKSSPFDRIDRYGKWKSTAGENISYGETLGRHVVLQLIIDDGVPSRGHRTNLYNPDFKVTGIACGAHKVYRTMCVIDYAGGYVEKSK